MCKGMRARPGRAEPHQPYCFCVARQGWDPWGLRTRSTVAGLQVESCCKLFRLWAQSKAAACPGLSTAAHSRCTQLPREHHRVGTPNGLLWGSQQLHTHKHKHTCMHIHTLFTHIIQHSTHTHTLCTQTLHEYTHPLCTQTLYEHTT